EGRPPGALRTRARNTCTLLLGLATVLTSTLVSPFSPTSASAAATFVVNTTADAAPTSPNACAATTLPAPPCTLRDAIAAADAAAGSTVQFSVSGTILLSSTLPGLVLSAPGTIDGTGQQVAVSGGDAVRVLRVCCDLPAPVHIRNLTLEHGSADSGGALSYFSGPGDVTNVDFKDNQATGDGGAVYSAGSLTITGSTFSGNSAARGAGAFNGGNMIVGQSTFSGNSVPVPTFQGGADLFNDGPVVPVTFSTFTNSTGGAITNGPNSSGTSVSDSILDHSHSGLNCTTLGAAFTVDHNLSDDHSCGGSAAPALLGTLGDRGGPTQTVNLLPGSPAIDAADQTAGVCPATDQRGVTRPAGGCDIGAYEYRPDSTTTVGTSGSPSSFGDAVTFTATVTPTFETGHPTGTVSFDADGGSLGTPVAVDGNGQAAITTSTLAAGHHTVHAAYGGDTHFTGSTGGVAQDVTAATSGTSLGSSLNPAPTGQAVTFTVTVTNFASTPTGHVALKDGGTTIATLTLDGAGTATYSTSTLAAGPHVMSAAYAGDSHSAPSTSANLRQVVQSPTSSGIVASANPSVFGPLTFTATVTGSVAGPRPTGSVTFLTGIGGGAASLDTNRRAAYSPSPNLPPGGYTITANYAGDDYWAPSTTSLSQTVTQAGSATGLVAAPSGNTVFDEPLTLTATVTPAGTTATPTGQVDFFDVNTNLGSAPLDAHGIAALPVGTLAVGAHQLVARYTGAAGFAASDSATVARTVDPAPTATTMALSANPAAYGQPLTIGATVAATRGAGVPMGVVNFLDGGSAIGTTALDGAGHASLVTSSLGVGAHQLSVSYGAVPDFGASASPVVAENVTSAATVVTVTADAPTSTYGFPVLISATVAAAAPSIAVGQGTVTFKEGTATLGTAGLDGGGQASLSVTLPGGGHTITVAFPGDGNLQAASGAVAITVSPALTHLTLVESAPSTTFGDPVTFTAGSTASGTRLPTGTMTFLDSTLGIIGTAPIDGTGTAALTLNSLPDGVHHVQADYSPGDGNWVGVLSNTVDLAVNAAPTSVSLTYAPLSLNAGGQVRITATVSGGLPGLPQPSRWVYLTAGGGLNPPILDQAVLSGGQATVTSFNLAQGVNFFYVQYGGDANYAPSARGIFLNVGGILPAVTLDSFPTASPLYGQTVTLMTTVSSSSGTPTGSVSFLDGTTNLGTVTLDGSGRAGLDVSTLTAGVHPIVAEYLGDGTFSGAASTVVPVTVARAPSYQALSWVGSPTPPAALTPLTLIGVVGAVGSATPPPLGGTLVFSEGGTALGPAVTLVGGEARLTLPGGLTAGNHAITLTYSGDPNVLPGAMANTLQVAFLATVVNVLPIVSPLRVGDPATVVAYLGFHPGPGSQIPTGAIHVALGVDSCDIAAPSGYCVITPTVPGTWSLSVTYAGDSLFSAGSVLVPSLVIAPPPPRIPTITLSVTPPTGTTCGTCAVVNVPTTVSWTMTGGPATGHLSVSAPDSYGCGAFLALSGSCPMTFNQTGTETLTVQFAGDSVYAPATATLDIRVLGCFILDLESGAGGAVSGPTPTSNCSRGYIEGTVVRATAVPDATHYLRAWNDLSGYGGTVTGLASPLPDIFLIVFQDRWLRADFGSVCFQVTHGPYYYGRVAAGGWVDALPGSNCPDQAPSYNGSYVTEYYVVGSRVTFVAHPEPGQQLYAWAGPVTSNTWSTVVTGNIRNFATFHPPCQAVTATATAGGTLAVTGGAPCHDPISGRAGYLAGFGPRLVATPAPGFFVDRWDTTIGGVAGVDTIRSGLASTENPATRVDSAYHAVFMHCAQLTLKVAGDVPTPSPALVTTTPAIACPLGASHGYYPGQQIHLRAPSYGTIDDTAPNADNTGFVPIHTPTSLTGFGGTPDDLPAPTYPGNLTDVLVTMDQDRTVTAFYAARGSCLSVNVDVQPAGYPATLGATFDRSLCRQYGLNLHHYSPHLAGDMSLTVTSTATGKVQPFWQVCCDMYADPFQGNFPETPQQIAKHGEDYLYAAQTYLYSGNRGHTVNPQAMEGNTLTYNVPS
ncbi:MAG TPA: Ig-like domain repeat protein, partial [Candidatus Dormibacteraeota bacterium]|nr:Ig-like domain repeat protein [Candidatus Dormibacteraeota bacterium]